jgi:hypothetical protein
MMQAMLQDDRIHDVSLEIERIRDLRRRGYLQHETELLHHQVYVDHIRRRLCKLSEPKDPETYSHIFEEIYAREFLRGGSEVSHPNSRPLDDILRLQALILRATHCCEVYHKQVKLIKSQGKAFMESIQMDWARIKNETSTLQMMVEESQSNKRLELQKLLDVYLNKVKSQNLAKQKLESSYDCHIRKIEMKRDDPCQQQSQQQYDDSMSLLETQMTIRRNRQSKSYQERMKEQSEAFKNLRHESFEKAREHIRRNSNGSHHSVDGLSHHSGRSATSGESGWKMWSSKKSQRGGGGNQSVNSDGRSHCGSGAGGRFWDRLFSLHRLEPEMTEELPKEIRISIDTREVASDDYTWKAPSTFSFLNGLNSELVNHEEENRKMVGDEFEDIHLVS